MTDNPYKFPGITEGRIVHYVLSNGDHRAAMIVNGWHGGSGNDHLVNLDVHTDYSNDLSAFPLWDGKSGYDQETRDQVKAGHFWATSIRYDDQAKLPGSWHWIEPA